MAELKQHYGITLTVRNVLARKVCLAASGIAAACKDRKGSNINRTPGSEFQGGEAYFRVKPRLARNRHDVRKASDTRVEWQWDFSMTITSQNAAGNENKVTSKQHKSELVSVNIVKNGNNLSRVLLV